MFGRYRMGGSWWHPHPGYWWGPPWAGGNPYWGPAMYGFPPPGSPYQPSFEYSRDLEIKSLKEQAAYFEKALEEIKKRLEELGETS
jgi:hypothetical protein